MEVRKYKENKEKIRKRKEEIRRRRSEALRQNSLNMCTLGSLSDTITGSVKPEADEDIAGVLPIQDYLLSSDEDDDIKAEINSPLIDKIVEGDKIVDELDALTTKRPLKRPLPSHRDINESSPSSSIVAAAVAAAAALAHERQEYKKRKMEKKEKRYVFIYFVCYSKWYIFLLLLINIRSKKKYSIFLKGQTLQECQTFV